MPGMSKRSVSSRQQPNYSPQGHACRVGRLRRGSRRGERNQTGNRGIRYL